MPSTSFITSYPLHTHQNKPSLTPLRPKMTYTERLLPNVKNGSTSLSVLLRTRTDTPLPRTATILCHGFQDSKHGVLITRLAHGLDEATVRFDFGGNGDSDGVFRYAGYRRDVADLRAVVLHVRALGVEVAGLVGHSKGGVTVLMYAREFGDVARVVNLAGRFDMRSGVRERFGEAGMREIEGGGLVVQGRRRVGGEVREFEYVVRGEDLEERFSIDMAEVVGGIREGVRVLTMHGDGDTVVDVENGRRIAQGCGGEIEVLKGCCHRFRGFEEAVLERMRCFGV